MKAKANSSENIGKVVTSLVRLIRNKDEKTNITNFRNQRGDITIDSINIKKIVREYYE